MADFFDRVKQEIDKGITAISAKSKEVVESTKVKGQIGTLQQQKRVALEELGNIVYVMFVKSGFDEERIKAKCEKVAGLDGQIKEKEEELRNIHLMAQKSLGLQSVVAACECGAEIYEGTKFCRRCGRKVGAIK